MDWPTVVKNLREEANKDRARAADAESIKRDAGEALMLRLASLVCSRLALALEAGHVAAGQEPLPEPVEKKQRGPKSAIDKAAVASPRIQKASRDFMGREFANKRKERTPA